MRTMTVAVIALALALPGVAQQSGSQETSPALLHDSSERAEDSRLVRAAKRSLALRQKAGNGKSNWVVDDSMVRHTRPTILQTNFGGGGKDVPASTAAPNQPATPAIDRAAVEKKLNEAKQEMRRMAAESDEPYGGDVSEDRVNQRLNQLPGEINTMNKQLQQAPPPQPPSPQPH
ncbi:MAG TPA: hypothetical protein VEZ11_10365 [Thermoanaerobaculia bacterium]|nr:hypothetical protein [Thermoanaerobaculia bacterium]